MKNGATIHPIKPRVDETTLERERQKDEFFERRVKQEANDAIQVLDGLAGVMFHGNMKLIEIGRYFSNAASEARQGLLKLSAIMEEQRTRRK